MDTTILQIPISKKLRDKAVRTAESSGFSSLQDVIRLFLHQFVLQEIGVKFESKLVKLSPKNERRYRKMHEDIVSGKVKTKSFTNVDDLMAYLNK